MASGVLADLPAESDVVRSDPVVQLRELDPFAQVVDDPLAVLLVRRVEECVRDQGCGGEIDGDVAPCHAIAHGLHDPPELVVPGTIVDPSCGGAHSRDVVEGQVVIDEVRVRRNPVALRPLQLRTAAARHRGPHQPFSSVIVGRCGVLAGVHRREADRPVPKGSVMRVRHPQGVEGHVALPVVHPVPVAVEFAVDLAVPCELPCDAFPDPAVEDIQLLRASEHVVEREAAEPLVCIVGRVHSTLVPFLPSQSAVGECVGLDELDPGAIQRFDQVALQDSPCGGRTWHVSADDGNSRKGFAAAGGERTRCEHGKLHRRGSL